MKKSNEAFLNILERFGLNCEHGIHQARALVAQMARGDGEAGVDQAAMKGVMEEYLALVEQKLIPLLRTGSTEKTKPSPTDRRCGQPRFKQDLAVRYGHPGKEVVFRDSFSCDIGVMGLFILADHKEKTGQNLIVEVTLPNGTKTTLEGVVVWNKWMPQEASPDDYSGFGLKVISAEEEWYSYFLANDLDGKVI